MKLTLTLATILPLLLLLLSWSVIEGLDNGGQALDQSAAALDSFTATESSLNRDILSARAGLLRDYDPLVREVGMLDTQLGRLRATGVVDPGIDQLAVTLRQQEDLTEQFKSDNALLQNALTYFGVFSTRLGSPGQSGRLSPAVSRVAASMLRLTLDTSLASVQELQQNLDQLAVHGNQADNQAVDADALQGLLSYGRLLQTLLPDTDRVVQAIFSLPQDRQAAAAKSMIEAKQRAARIRAARYRLLLYATSLLLLGLLIYLGQQLRRQILAQRRRASFEQLIAKISMLFIKTHWMESDQNVEQALALLAAWVGADRAYFMQCGTPSRLHAWTGAGVTAVPGWPDLASKLVQSRDPGIHGIHHVRCVQHLPPGTFRDGLVAAGVRGWVCVAGIGPGGNACLLGFDSVEVPIRIETTELRVLRMALDTLASALGRDLLEQDRALLQARVQQARRMETIAALTSGVAHNFNNIVGAILGYAEMGEAMPEAHGSLAQSLAGIRQAAERARDLVEQLMKFGRRKDAHPRIVRLQPLLAETRSQLDASLPPGIRLVVQDIPEEAVVSGETAQLQQVVVNLCNNAAQAMDGDGVVTVGSDMQELAQELPLSHGHLTPGSWIRLSVRDTGRGINPTTLEHLFEPFFTTRPTGNGLGLATVREIVQEHAGAMHVVSEPGLGSLFEVWLPRIQAAQVEAALPTPSAPSLPLGKGETILVVNEHREQLLRDEDILAALGYEPVGFARAEDVLSACREAPERFDVLLISHITSPSPLDLARSIHDIVPQLGILLAGTGPDTISAETRRAAGISGILHRPLDSVELAYAVALHLNFLENAE